MEREEGLPSLEEEEIMRGMNNSERRWFRMQDFLEHRGYKIEVRPGSLPELDDEDDISITSAIRICDGRPVWLLPNENHTLQLPIANVLSEGSLRSDPRNNVLPIFDVIPIPSNDRFTLLVVPPLGVCKAHRFKRIGHVLSFVRQLLQGLVFMHENNVAHRNITIGTLLLDASQQYSPPPHVLKRLLFRCSHSFNTQKFYYLHSGCWKHFPDPDEPRLMVGMGGRNRTIPELSEFVPYDPFKVDVRSLADTIKEFVLDECEGLQFLEPLIMLMLSDNPAERPTAAECLEEFERVVRKIKPFRKWKRVAYRDELPEITLCGLYWDFILVLHDPLVRLGRAI